MRSHLRRPCRLVISEFRIRSSTMNRCQHHLLHHRWLQFPCTWPPKAGAAASCPRSKPTAPGSDLEEVMLEDTRISPGAVSTPRRAEGLFFVCCFVWNVKTNWEKRCQKQVESILNQFDFLALKVAESILQFVLRGLFFCNFFGLLFETSDF